jgi:excisionase family DNA binding protein
MTDAPQQRFLKLTDVQEILQISPAQAYALVRSGDLPAIRVGGRHQWRVERAKLEAFLEESYRRTAEAIAAGLSVETGQEHAPEEDAAASEQLG